MEPNTHKLIHSFGALADLGQEVADTGDFMEMVRTSLHLLLGTLAIRRGAVLELPAHLERTNCLATWGLSQDYGEIEFLIDAGTKDALARFHHNVCLKLMGQAPMGRQTMKVTCITLSMVFVHRRSS